MPIHAINHLFDTSEPPVEIGVQFVGVGATGTLEFFYSDIPGGSWTPPRIAQAEQWVQDRIDFRIDRSTLDPNHPYIKNGDPGLSWVFWDGADVIERFYTFTDLTFDGEHSDFNFNRINRRLEPL